LQQSMKDAPLTICPKDLCRQKTWGKGRVKRQMGAGAGLIFKGSGFYITDYRSAGYQAAAKSEAGGAESKKGDAKPAGDAKAAGDAKKTETKPAATEKSKPAKKKEN